MRVRARTSEMVMAKGKLVAATRNHSKNEFHSDVKSSGWSHAPTQLPKPQTGGPTSTSRAMLKLMMSTKMTG